MDKFYMLGLHLKCLMVLKRTYLQDTKRSCHLTFDIKMGEYFRRKTLTHSSVVSRDSVGIVLTITALNALVILFSDIQNAYLTAKCREKLW